MRSLLSLLLLAAALPLTLVACDTYDGGYDDGFYDGQQDRPRVRVVDFTLDGDRYDISDSTTVASFQDDDVRDSDDRSRLRTALRTAGDGALVVAYIDTRTVIDTQTGGQTFSALPLTRSQEAFVSLDVNGDSTISPGEGVPYVDYSLSYEYSFDNDNFYFDVVSSARGDGFPGGARAFFDAVIPIDVNLRVVTVPADIINKTTVDWTDYAAVKAAFNLPD